MTTVSPSAERTDLTDHPLYDQADRIVVKWIACEEPAPRTLSDLVDRYRILDLRIANEGTKTEESLYDESNALYNKLLSVAMVQCRVNVEVAHQARHTERRDFTRMTYSQRCDQAIALWRKEMAH
jgi:hypothetical protein